MSEAKQLANLINCEVWHFANGQLAAANSDLAKQLAASSVVVQVVKPDGASR